MASLAARQTALIVVDVQKAFDELEAVGKRRNNPEAINRIKDILADFRAKRALIVHVRHASHDAASPLRHDRPGYAVRDEAREQLGELVLVKHVNSSFIGTDLEARLKDRGITCVVIVGATTNHCVETTARMAGNLGFDIKLVPLIFLTHLHHDHISDMAFFLLEGWMLNRTGSPVVVGPSGTASFIKSLLEGGAFDVDIRARAKCPVRKANMEAIRPIVREYEAGVIYEDADLRVTAFEVDHIPADIARCYGFRIEAENKVVAFSGDTKPCKNIPDLARGADLLIHECTFPEAMIAHRVKSGVGTAAHTSPTELGQIAREACVKSLVATHFGHFDSLSPVLKRAAANHLPVDQMGPEQLDLMARDIRAHYSGPLRLAHDLMRIDL